MRHSAASFYLQLFLIPLGLLALSPTVGAQSTDLIPLGSLIIVGGGDTPLAVQSRFVALAGGSGKAKIAIFPMASTEFDEEAKEVQADFKSLNADAELINIERDEAQTESTSQFLEGYSGYWFLGGDQTRLAESLVGARVLEALGRRYMEGAVIGGTSAGASVMAQHMLTGKRKLTSQFAEADWGVIARGTYEVAYGFGFLQSAIVDQHFLKRARYNRLLSAVLEQPRLIGVGIDEDTAVLVRPDGRWEVLGDSYVKIFDARRAHLTQDDDAPIGASGVTMHLLPAGAVFDPTTGQVTLPGRLDRSTP